jgi:hypothetical protein
MSPVRTMVTLAVNIGNLGPTAPARRPMGELVRDLDAAFRGFADRVRVLDFFAHRATSLSNASADRRKWPRLWAGSSAHHVRSCQ